MSTPTPVRRPSLRALLLAAPPVLVAHVLEEAPRFVPWFNAHVARGITAPLFWSVNSAALVITTCVVAAEWLRGTALTAALVVAWLACLMFANALFHVAGAFVDGGYVPGLATALLLYLPLFGAVVTRLVRLRRLSPRAAAIATLLGAAPMLAHGYLILFRGSRLF